jgi:DNA replication protein DnaC
MPTAPQLSASSNAVPNQKCPECDGQKYYRYDLEFGHPLFGRYFPCGTCNAAAVDDASGLNPVERLVTFADIETKGRPGAAAMITAAREFVKGGRTGFLSVYGGYGNGKSTLLKAIVNDCIANGIEAQYVTMTKVMMYVREAFNSGLTGDSDFSRVTKLARVQVLVIDECEKGRMSEHAREIQTHLFDERYRASYELGTVLAWNGEFETFDLPWVRSRLSEYLVVKNSDADMRPLLGGMA